MKFQYLFLLVLLSCQPDFVSEAGIEYTFEGPRWSTEQVNAQEQWFIARVPIYAPGAVQDALKLAHVTVTKSKFRCSGSATGWCNGQQDGRHITVVDLGCPGRSALTHELAHFLQQELEGVTDYDHKDISLYRVADSQSPGGCQ